MTTPAARYTKDPSAVLDYKIDWSAWLPDGDTIASAAWAFTGGISEANITTPIAGGVVTVWIQGGTVGTNATARCRITTAAGRVDDRTIELQVRER